MPYISREDSSTPVQIRRQPLSSMPPVYNGFPTRPAPDAWDTLPSAQRLATRPSHQLGSQYPAYPTPYHPPLRDFTSSASSSHSRINGETAISRTSSVAPPFQTPSRQVSQQNLASTTTVLDQHQAELTRLRSQESLGHGQNFRIEELERELQEKSELVEKQKVTIKNQSQALSNPKTYQQAQGPRQPYMTPTRTHASTPQHPNTAQQKQLGPPPTFDPTPNGHSIPNGPRSQSTQPKLTIRPSSTAPSDPFGPSATPRVDRARSQDPPSQVRPSVTSTALVLVGKSPETDGFTTKFASLFQKSERFAYCYANVPNVTLDARLHTAVKDALIAASNETTAYPLLRQSTTRYFLLSALINRWLVFNILKLEVFESSSRDIVLQIREERNQVYKSRLNNII